MESVVLISMLFKQEEIGWIDVSMELSFEHK